jgi:hypothetical protein
MVETLKAIANNATTPPAAVLEVARILTLTPQRQRC